jgi:uncharacterized protein YjbI with pentapeptide repeats
MADDGSQQRKPDFRTAVEDAKALATVLVMELESVLGRRLRRLKPRSPAVLAAIGVVATLALALVVVMVLLQTGDANAVSDNAAIIAALVGLGGVFTAQMVSIALNDQRSVEARDLEAQRADDAALQNYFEDVGELLIEKSLREASPSDNLSTVVRAQTLSVLEGLDPERKRILLQFLYESGLIYKDKPVVSLVSANLNGAALRLAHLRKADLSQAYLRDAVLSGADLIDADLSSADLSGAELISAEMTKANLSQAWLLGRTNLTKAVLIEADLSGAMMSGAILTKAALIETDLRGAYMPGANLTEAELIEADLHGAYLPGADLSGAILTRADLSGIIDWTEEQLLQARSLEGATMPNGQKYEDWLKDK